MAQRLVKFTAAQSKSKSTVLPDGRKVKKDEVVEVDPIEASRSLLRYDADGKRDWEPVARKMGEG